MLCQDCNQRHVCERPCESLERELKKYETYQKELPLEPGALNFLAHKNGLTWHDIHPDTPFLWPEMSGYLGLLDHDELETFLLHFHQNMRTGEVARRLKVSRITVYRRISRSLTVIRREKEKAPSRERQFNDKRA